MPSINQKVNGKSPFQRLWDQQVKILHAGIPQIDTFLGGFNSSTITLIDSNHPFSFEMLSMLCVNAIKTFEGNVVYVDGGISIDPYSISSLSKRSGLRADAVLSKIKVTRAFTTYQLDSIITDRLEAGIDEYTPVLLIITCITEGTVGSLDLGSNPSPGLSIYVLLSMLKRIPGVFRGFFPEEVTIKIKETTYFYHHEKRIL